MLPHSTLWHPSADRGQTALVVDAAPFVALRYDAGIVGDLAATSAPAYDDLERFTYAQHRTASPYTVLELLTGEGDGYRTAATTFERWLRTGVLVRDSQPAYYLYEIHELRRGIPTVLRGVLAAVAVEGDTLLPHESVDPARVAARSQRVAAVPADLAPVFAVHTPAPPQLREALDATPRSRPVIALTDEAGTDHRIWSLTDADVVSAITTGLAQVRAVIADGHHRFAAAAAATAGGTSDGRTLVYLVDGAAYGPRLDAIHRLVRGSPVAILQRLRAAFDTRPVPFDSLEEQLREQPAGTFGIRITGGDSGLLIPKAGAQPAIPPPGASQQWAGLDAALWEYGVRALLGSPDVAYRSDVAAAAREVDAEPAALFLLRPPRLDDVFACALAGEAMPAKSTWFRPKPRAGLVMRSLD